MKKIILILFLFISCACDSKYKMVTLPTPIKDEFSTNLNAYLIKPTNTSNVEFKEIYDLDLDIDINDFRLLVISWDDSNKENTKGSMIYIIDHNEHPYIQENQSVPYNPWEEYLVENTNLFIRGMDSYATYEEGVIYDMFENYDYESISVLESNNSLFYFKGASEEEIINYIKQIPLSIQVSGDNSNHYTFGYCSHTYIINDINLYVESEDGNFELQ